MAFGLGLRREHYAAAAAGEAAVDWFEVITENFMDCGGQPMRTLERVRSRYEMALHGVSLSIGSSDPLDRDYLKKLAALVARVEPVRVSDHLCWTGVAGVNTHELLPLPYTREALDLIVTRVDAVQTLLRRQLLLENVSSYLRIAGSEMTEWAFLNALAARTGCGLLLDVNNVYVASRNQGFDPFEYLEGIDASHVAEIHLAGHQDEGGWLVDTHDAPVSAPVWALYAAAVARCGSIPTLLERDAAIPPLSELELELGCARRIAASMSTRHAA